MASSVLYAEAQDVRTADGTVSTAGDTYLDELIEECSRLVDNITGRAEHGFVAGIATALQFVGAGQRWIYTPEFTEVTLLEVKDSVGGAYVTVTAGQYSGFRGDPSRASSVRYDKLPYHGVILLANSSRSHFLNGGYAQMPGFRPVEGDVLGAFLPTVRVTAKWGYAESVPSQIKRLVIMQVIRWYKRQRGAMADALINPDLGQTQYVRSLDPDIKLILEKGKWIIPSFAGGNR